MALCMCIGSHIGRVKNFSGLWKHFHDLLLFKKVLSILPIAMCIHASWVGSRVLGLGILILFIMAQRTRISFYIRDCPHLGKKTILQDYNL